MGLVTDDHAASKKYVAARDRWIVEYPPAARVLVGKATQAHGGIREGKSKRARIGIGKCALEHAVR